jgi:hypothetical protein
MIISAGPRDLRVYRTSRFELTSTRGFADPNVAELTELTVSSGGGGTARRLEVRVVGLTALALSCTAKAYVPKSRGATVATARRDQRRESDVGRRAAGHVRDDRGGSAAGPKPGRAGFSD